jgi:TPR repeat protein
VLGNCYDYGIGTNVDKEKAFGMCQKAATSESNAAQFNLALMYANGGVDKDENKALELFRKLAEKGFLGGTLMLGNCYYHGIGTINVDTFEMCQKAANLGSK